MSWFEYIATILSSQLSRFKYEWEEQRERILSSQVSNPYLFPISSLLDYLHRNIVDPKYSAHIPSKLLNSLQTYLRVVGKSLKRASISKDLVTYTPLITNKLIQYQVGK